MTEPPEAIMITISQAMLKEKGLASWTRNFLQCIDQEGCAYFMRLGSQPKHQVLYVYLCIGGKVRYRANFVETHPEGAFTFNDGKVLHGKAWVVLAGPVVKAPAVFPRKGFRGFRYTNKIF